MRLPVAAEGYPFIALAAAAVALAAFFALPWLFALTLIVAVFIVAFFRDPERVIPEDPQAIVSPADGRVILVGREREGRLLCAEALKVSIFMNVFNVHVNRCPADATVLATSYNPGKFVSANLDKASLENEQNAILMESAESTGARKFVVCQIAGLVARRIVSYAREKMHFDKGGRIGMIRFGSRVDLYLPTDARVIVSVGDRVKAGSTVIGYW